MLLFELVANTLCDIQITFTSSCAMAACIIGYLDSFDHKTTTVYKVPLFSWLLVLTAIWPALALAAVAVNVSVLLIEAALSFLENVSYVLMGLSRALKCAIRLLQCIMRAQACLLIALTSANRATIQPVCHRK